MEKLRFVIINFWLLLLLINAPCRAHRNRDSANIDKVQNENAFQNRHYYPEFYPFLDHRRKLRDLDNNNNNNNNEEEKEEEYDPHYPYEDVRLFVKNNPILKDYFETAFAPQIAHDGMLPENEGEGICRVSELKRSYPQKLKNINNVSRTIVNIQGEYEQIVETKTCKSTKCTNLTSLPFDFTSYCEQQFTTQKLMVFNSTTYFDVFQFPSCCVCKIKQVKTETTTVTSGQTVEF